MSPKKVLRNGEILGPVTVDGKVITFSNTSSYDSITEILVHATRRSQQVEQYFEHNRDSAKAELGLCYATAVLNHARRGPDSEAYKYRETFLYENTSLARGRVACFMKVPFMILTDLTRDYEDVCSTCFSCSLDSKFRLNLTMKQVCTGIPHPEVYGYLKDIDSRPCRKCNRKSKRAKGRSRPVKPFVSICTEQNGLLIRPMYCTTDGDDELKASFDVLPKRFVVDGCEYVLCGLIARTRSADRLSYHYVAYCRGRDGKWDKRDGLDEEIEELTQLPTMYFSQIFYANVGYWSPKERKLLKEPAKSAWYQVTEIELPELCVEKILSYLDNKQLQLLINGAKEDSFNN